MTKDIKINSRTDNERNIRDMERLRKAIDMCGFEKVITSLFWDDHDGGDCLIVEIDATELGKHEVSFNEDSFDGNPYMRFYELKNIINYFLKEDNSLINIIDYANTDFEHCNA